MLSGTQFIWYIFLVLLHKRSFVCISSFHLFPLFKKRGFGTPLALQSQLHSAVIRASQLFPFFSQKSQPASTSAQMNDCCLLCRIISQEMRVHRCLWHLYLPSPHSICSSLCFSSGKQNAAGMEGEKERPRVQSLMRGLMMTSMKDLIEVPPRKLYCLLFIRQRKSSLAICTGRLRR